MAIKTAILLVFSIVVLSLAELQAKDVEKEFEDADIVPDVVSTAPKGYLGVKYPKVTVDLGNELTPDEASEEPEVEFDGDDGQLYTFGLMDPDAPNRNNYTYRNYLHWLVINIPGPSNIAKGDTVTEYVGPAPVAGGGLHRYVLLVFQQENEITANVEGRRSFDMKQFARDHELVGPLFGNYFRAQTI